MLLAILGKGGWVGGAPIAADARCMTDMCQVPDLAISSDQLGFFPAFSVRAAESRSSTWMIAASDRAFAVPKHK